MKTNICIGGKMGHARVKVIMCWEQSSEAGLCAERRHKLLSLTERKRHSGRMDSMSKAEPWEHLGHFESSVIN